MNILLVTHYFPPEVGAPQARLSEMARTWAADGHQVQVLTGFPNHPTGEVHPGYRHRRTMTEQVDGYWVERTWLYATPNEGLARKTLSHLSFMVSSVALGRRRIERPDVVVVSSPTFFSILSAWILARSSGAKLVVEVRDLWPGIFVELGVLTNRWLIAALERLELAAYRAADLVVVVTQGFADDLIARGVPPAKVEVLTNGVDLDRFSPGPADPAVRRQLGAGDTEHLVVYIGAHGISQGLDAAVGAAELLGDRIHLAMVGEGARKTELQRAAANATNVSFHPAVPRDEVLPILRSADTLLVPLRDVPGFSTFIPSKMFEFMAAGTPVVGAVRGEAARILDRAGALVVTPERPDELAAAIAHLIDHPGEAKERADAARNHVERHYDRAEMARNYLDQLAMLVGPAGRGGDR